MKPETIVEMIEAGVEASSALGAASIMVRALGLSGVADQLQASSERLEASLVAYRPEMPEEIRTTLAARIVIRRVKKETSGG